MKKTIYISTDNPSLIFTDDSIEDFITKNIIEGSDREGYFEYAIQNFWDRHANDESIYPLLSQQSKREIRETIKKDLLADYNHIEVEV